MLLNSTVWWLLYIETIISQVERLAEFGDKAPDEWAALKGPVLPTCVGKPKRLSNVVMAPNRPETQNKRPDLNRKHSTSAGKIKFNKDKEIPRIVWLPYKSVKNVSFNNKSPNHMRVLISANYPDYEPSKMPVHFNVFNHLCPRLPIETCAQSQKGQAL